MKIAVAGAGYVGLSIATLLAQNHQVTLVDIVPEKVDKVNKRISPTIVPVLLAWQRIVRYQLPDALVLHLTPMFIVGIPYATLQARSEMLLFYIT